MLLQAHDAGAVLGYTLTQSLALSLTVPSDVPSGTYYGQVSLNEHSQSLTLTVAGADVALGELVEVARRQHGSGAQHPVMVRPFDHRCLHRCALWGVGGSLARSGDVLLGGVPGEALDRHGPERGEDLRGCKHLAVAAAATSSRISGTHTRNE